LDVLGPEDPKAAQANVAAKMATSAINLKYLRVLMTHLLF
jgi:hypothetical protein